MADLGSQLARAIATKDADALRTLLRPDVEFRAMTPGRFWESDSSTEVIDEIILAKWLEPTDRVDGLDSIESADVEGRARVGYRFRVTNDDGTFLVEQQAYYDVEDGQISWLRIMCAGFRPVRPD